MLSATSRKRVQVAFTVVLAAVIGVSAIGMHYPSDWLLENVCVVIGLAYLAATARRWPVSTVSYALVLVFFALHEVGAHWTYSEVPYNHWWQSLFGVRLNDLLGWQRNNYDRLVHFSYGLLLTHPMREQLLQVVRIRGPWSYVLPAIICSFTSLLYELIEWAAAVVFGGDLGTAYLGTQGDPWDAQHDMALVTVGAILAMLVSAEINRRRGRDPAREFAEMTQATLSRPPFGKSTKAVKS